MAAHQETSAYRIYLLTIWLEQAEADAQRWRFHLTDPQTGKRYGFTDPADLLALLQRIWQEQSPPDEAPQTAYNLHD